MAAIAGIYFLLAGTFVKIAPGICGTKSPKPTVVKVTTLKYKASLHVFEQPMCATGQKLFMQGTFRKARNIYRQFVGAETTIH